MQRCLFLVAVLLAPLPLGGCLAKAAFDVATAPVRIAVKAVDLATTSQSEADEKRGREMRLRDERLGALERDYHRHASRCLEGREESCRRAELARAEMSKILPSFDQERQR